MGMEANIIPTYSAELPPSAIRGSLVNFYQWWQIVGNVVSASAIYGTSMALAGQWQYKLVMTNNHLVVFIQRIGIKIASRYTWRSTPPCLVESP